MKAPTPARRLLLVPLAVCCLFAGGAVARVQDVCGPFTDVSPALCPYVLEMYYLGITAGTSPTTYSPDATLTRGQAAVFVSKGVNQAIARSSRRAALGQWWTTSTWVWRTGLGRTLLPGSPSLTSPVVSDGTDVWVGGFGQIFRVRASDGKLLGAWTTASSPTSLVIAMGRAFAVEFDVYEGDSISMIDPGQPPGAATVVVSGLTNGPSNLAFDGSRLFRSDSAETVSIITPAATAPWLVTTVGGFESAYSMVFDGANMWLYEVRPCRLLRLDSAAGVVQTIELPGFCTAGPVVFDGTNVLVPSVEGFVAIRASDGSVTAEVLTNPSGSTNGLAFDGERILVLSDAYFQAPDRLVLVRASDFAVLRDEPYNEGFGNPFLQAAASDGLNFWMTAATNDGLALVRY
jgi:hypothetical protein